MKMSMKIIICIIVACLLLTSCVTAPVQKPQPAQPLEPADIGARERLEIVDYSRSLLGMKDLTGERAMYRNDCSGLVLGVYQALGHEVRLIENTGTTSISHRLFETLEAYGLVYYEPPTKQADVVFFKRTIEESGDNVSHVGIVDEILEDGTIRILNYTSRGVTELRMNLITPHLHQDENGNVINDFLKKKSPLKENEELLAGEFFFCFGDLLKYTAY
jgi:hypothetical protein